MTVLGLSDGMSGGQSEDFRKKRGKYEKTLEIEAKITDCPTDIPVDIGGLSV